MTLNKFMLDLKMEGRTFIINISQEYHDWLNKSPTIIENNVHE
jgi:hypothetical protein